MISRDGRCFAASRAKCLARAAVIEKFPAATLDAAFLDDYVRWTRVGGYMVPLGTWGISSGSIWRSMRLRR